MIEIITYGSIDQPRRPIYLHSTSARQHHLVDAVTARAHSELGKADEPPRSARA
jgi:hypothetical protein